VVRLKDGPKGSPATTRVQWKKYKVAWIQNIIAPYTRPFFERLSQHPSIDLFAYFCAKTHKERKDAWGILESDKFNYTILPGITVESWGIIYHINPTIIPKLIKGKYDVIIIGDCTDFTMQAAFITSKLLKTPIILHSEATKSAQWFEGVKGVQWLLLRAVNPLRKYIIRRVNALVVPWTICRDFLLEQGAQAEKVFIAPGAIGDEMFSRQSSRLRKEKERLKQQLNINSKKAVLYVGGLIRRKGVGYLIEAYGELKRDCEDACLMLVGDGPLRTELEESCVTHHIKDIHFLGYKSYQELPKYYSMADVFVLPTLEDIGGLVVHGAMACGLPVITTKAAGCAVDLIVPGENGFVVDEASAGQLCSAIKRIISNETLAREMGNKSLEMVNTRWNINENVNGVVSAIGYVCGERKP